MTVTLRKDVRQTTVALLDSSTVAPLTDPDVVVYDSRSGPVQPEESAAIIVDTPAQRDETQSAGPPIFRPVLTLVIEIHVTGDADAAVQARADELDEAVKLTLFGTPSWVCQFSRFLRLETLSEVSQNRSVRRAIVRILMDLEWHRVYDPLPAFMVPFLGVDVETQPIDPATGEPQVDPISGDPLIAATQDIELTGP